MFIFQHLVASLSIYFLCLPVSSESARILASVATPSYSHQVAFRTIWKELAKRGHEIVLLTTDPMEGDIKNLRQIDLSSSYEIMKRHNFSAIVLKSSNNIWKFISEGMVTMRDAQRHQLLKPEVQALIHNSSEKFDLIMLEVIFPIHIGFAERFKVPVIGLTSLDANGILHSFMGNDDHSVLHPQFGLTFTSYPPSFLDRITSVLFNGFMNMYGTFIVNPMINEIVKDVFGENSRSIDELMKEMDMLFINVNPILHPIRAVTPNTIMFGGGTHVDKESKPLPEEIKKFLDNASNGAIYFSLGSNVKSALIRDDLRQVFIDTFKELPYKVLWKFENEELPDKPDNVMIQKWVPQSDVLRHPNIKVFITQCGLQSMEEAITNHIPLVAIPYFADQPANAMTVKNKGFGITLDHTKLTKDQFKEALLEVINNPKFKERTIEIANLNADVEMTGLDKVVWWTEYVIRNKGAKLLRNPIRDLPFYQYYLLDVIGFVSLICFIVIFGVTKISLFMYRLVRQMMVDKSKKD